MRAYYCDHFALPLPPGHRFPMQKYALLREQALVTGVLAPEDLHVPGAATDEQLLRVHHAAYIHKVVQGQLSQKEIRRIGFPWSPELVKRSRRSVGGTISACRAALEDGIAVNLAGGTHHAFPDYGSGFCVFNDVAVAARTMLAEQRARRVTILDCDVHQGDGTAACLAHDSRVFTFSMHSARNFPFRKQHSDLDIELPDGTGDTDYLDALQHGVDRAIEQGRPDLVLYVAGADPYVGDRLGRLAVSKAGLAQRDQLVLRRCQAARLPTAIVMAGGYAHNVHDIVDIHLQTVRAAAEMAHK